MRTAAFRPFPALQVEVGLTGCGASRRALHPALATSSACRPVGSQVSRDPQQFAGACLTAAQVSAKRAEGYRFAIAMAKPHEVDYRAGRTVYADGLARSGCHVSYAELECRGVEADYRCGRKTMFRRPPRLGYCDLDCRRCLVGQIARAGPLIVRPVSWSFGLERAQGIGPS